MNKSITIEIDAGSGFCFGVVNAIQKAEENLKLGEDLHCLGDIVHNNMEMERLEKLGLKTIQQKEYKNIKNRTILLRAHGEPPLTYSIAQKNNIKLIDATCPVVLRLQRSVKQAYINSKINNGQVVIYGKKGHAEVIGLAGQTENQAIIIESIKDVNKVDLTRPISIFSQTTMMVDKYSEIKEYFQHHKKSELNITNSICKQVSGRIEALQQFSKSNDVVLFVSGKKSSNGKALYKECLKVNPNTYMITTSDEIDYKWLNNIHKVGICGATSTPEWLMKEVAESIRNEANRLT